MASFLGRRYCDEFSFRWNERKSTDAERTLKALNLIQGASQFGGGLKDYSP